MDFILDKYQIIKEDEDLTYFDGVAVQKDKTKSVEYGSDYFNKYVKYEGTPTAILINKSRVNITEKYCKTVLDIGIGSGEFIKFSKIKVYGFDVNPVGVNWLKFQKLYINPYDYVPEIDGWTFWDSLEHFPEPQKVLNIIRPGHYIFISIPIFSDILKIKECKHYRKNEHYYYFTAVGLINYMRTFKFRLLEHTDAEIKAGRKNILTFVFQHQS